MSIFRAAMTESAERLTRLAADDEFVATVERAAGLIASTVGGRGTVYACGNGGSLTDAVHFAEEFSGRFRSDRRPLRAQAIADPAHITCTANDFGYEDVFSRYVEAFLTEEDVLLALSTSGSSKNVVKAADAAHRNGARVISITGAPGSALAKRADIAIEVGASTWSDRIQETEIVLLHAIVESVERDLGLA